MPGAKVFISSSAKPCRGACAWAGDRGGPCPVGTCDRSSAEREFVKGLADSLTADYSVVWDGDGKTLLAGEEWRDVLYSEFAACRAAVIVLTHSSLESAYVPLEAMVLVWRWLLDPTFIVIPIFFTPIDENTVKDPEKRFYGIGLENLQGLKHQPRTAQQPGGDQQTYAKVRERLVQVVPSVPLNSIHVVHEIAKLLEEATEPALEAAAKELDAEYEWQPGMPRPFQLALAVLRRDLATSIRALAKLVGSLEPWKRKRLCDLITPQWVALSAAAALRQAGTRLIVLNASWKRTADHYALRAWCHDPGEVRVLPVTAADDGSGEAIYTAVLDALRQTLIVQFPTADLDTREDIVALLRWRAENEIPMYIRIDHGPGISVEALAAVQRRLPVPIVYVRADVKPGDVGSSAYVVEPLLDPAVEQAARLAFNAAQITLLQPNV